jgi:hypothetical protein
MGWQWPTGCAACTTARQAAKKAIQSVAARFYRDIYDEMNDALQPPTAIDITTTDSDPATSAIQYFIALHATGIL